MLAPVEALVGPEVKKRIESLPWNKRIPAGSTYELLRAVAAEQPDADALTFLPTLEDDARPVRASAREFFGNVTRAANLFTRVGATRANAVAILLPFLPETHYALWGAEASSIAMPINVLLSAEHIAQLIQAARSKVLVALGPSTAIDIWSKVAAIRERIPALKVLCVAADGGLPAGEADFRELLARESATALDLGADPLPDDTAAFFHTGGTTGAPKLARHSQAGQVYAAWALTQAFHFSPSDRCLSGLPPFHVAGSIIVGLAPLAAGASILMPTAAGLRNPRVVQNYWGLVERHRATIVGGVPTTMAALLQAPRPTGDISSVGAFITGGALLPAGVAERFEEVFGVGVREVFGMTEGTSTIAVTPRLAKRRNGWAGFGLPYVELAVAKVDRGGLPGNRLPPGEPGVVLYRGPNVFPGYLDPSRNAGVLLGDGWLVSGDLGVVDEEGWVRLTGRSKDLIIRGGHNIDPSLIEDAASAHPDVAGCAAVGQPDAYAGEVPVLYVVTRSGADLDSAQLMDHIASRVGEPPARPRSIYVVPEIPTTEVGKIFKPALRIDAARRAVEALATRCASGDVDYVVEADNDERLGLFARIRVTGADPARTERFVSDLKDATLGLPVAVEVITG